MARIRTIKPEFWEDEKIAQLPMSCRLFFIGTWNVADDAGVFRSNAALLKSKIFPYDDIRTSEIQKYLDALVEARMILPISHNGESFYVIRTFRSHQKFDARYPNLLINKEILNELTGAQSSPSEHPTSTQRAHVGDSPREGEGEREREEVVGKGDKGGMGENADDVSSPPTPTPLESAFSEFQKWIKEHAPRVAKMKEPFTILQYQSIKNKFPPDLVAETLKSMHNYEPLLSKNRSANLTLRKWIINQNTNEKSNQTTDRRIRI